MHVRAYVVACCLVGCAVVVVTWCGVVCMQNKGLDSEADYSYSAMNAVCWTQAEARRVALIDAMVQLPPNNEAKMVMPCQLSYGMHGLSKYVRQLRASMVVGNDLLTNDLLN